MPQTNGTEVDHLQGVSDWLSDNGPWLLVLDNVDDLTMFFSKSDSLAKPISVYLPQTTDGRILITTRDRRVGERVTGRIGCIQVPPPSATEAAQLLNSKLPDDDYDLEACSALLEKLAYLPLAITQATAFMTENNIGLFDYMDVLEAHGDLELVQILNEDSGDIRRDSENSNSVIKTWRISFDQIRRQNKRAAQILSRMAVLDPQGVPKVLLERMDERRTEFIAAIGTLQSFSLITVDKDKTNYKMHHLIQVAMEQWLGAEGSLTSTQQEALQSVQEVYPTGYFESWQTCELLYPHAQIVAKYDLQDHSSQLTQADLLSQLAVYQLQRGRLEQARQHIIAAINIKERLLDQDDISTTQSRSLLGMIYGEIGELNLAQEIFRDALTHFETHLGPDDMEVLSTKMNLAVSLKNDNLQERETVHREIMTALERTERQETDLYFDNLVYLAVNLRGQGRLEESEVFFTQAVVGTQKMLGPEHPSTLMTMAGLSALCIKADEEEDRLPEVLHLQEKALGPDHPQALRTANALVNSLIRRARLEEAETLALPVLQKMEKTLGPKHPRTLVAASNLGSIYQKQERFALSKEFHERAVQRLVEVLGQNNPITLTAWWCYMSMPPEWRQIDEPRAFDADHPVSITALVDQARRLYDQGRCSEAETQARMALRSMTDSSGPPVKLTCGRSIS